MSELTSAARKRVKTWGLPDQKKYPMPDAEHAGNAKARAKQQLDKGHITQAEYDKICATADRVLGKKGMG